jgi:adenylosuccinate lyase
VVSFFMDQISEHQRDLTNSASGRFVAEYVAGFAAAASRMRSVLRGLGIHRVRMAQNLAMGGEMVFSEALYILVATGGGPDAHEKVRRATLQVEKSGGRLLDVLRADPVLWSELSAGLARAGISDAQSFFSNPANYRGRAAEKAMSTAERWRQRARELRKEIAG